jgi:RNA polymerase sigma-70 factor (ECF subfamily)
MSTNELDAQLEALHSDSFGWALSCCGWDPMEAEEVLQASYLKVLEGRARFAGRSSFKTWLFGVIRRTAAEVRRRRLLRRIARLRWLNGRPSTRTWSADAESVLVRSESSDELLRAVARLSRRQRELLQLVFYQDLSIRQAAEVLGLSVGTARTHYERAKRRLRLCLAPGREP